MSLTLTADNISSGLTAIMDAYNSGSPISNALTQAVSGQVKTLTLSDGNTGYTVSLSFEDSDSNINNAEALILDISGTKLRIEGDIPRDIGSVYSLFHDNPE